MCFLKFFFTAKLFFFSWAIFEQGDNTSIKFLHIFSMIPAFQSLYLISLYMCINFQNNENNEIFQVMVETYVGGWCEILVSTPSTLKQKYFHQNKFSFHSVTTSIQTQVATFKVDWIFQFLTPACPDPFPHPPS